MDNYTLGLILAAFSIGFLAGKFVYDPQRRKYPRLSVRAWWITRRRWVR